MPYIKQDRRKELTPILADLALKLDNMEWTPGDLNYCIFRLCCMLFHWRPGYQTINDLKGALGCAWDEFNRREVAPYEDKKLKENGDI